MAPGVKLPGLWISSSLVGISIIFLVLAPNLNHVQAVGLGEDCNTTVDCTVTGSECTGVANETCQCSGGYIEEGDKCKSDHTESCASDNECRIGLKCLSGVSAASTEYCLCDPKNSKFWHVSTATCKSVDDLAVSITNTATTATDVTFTWTADSFNLQGVAYEIKWNEDGPQSKTVTSSPSSVTDLTPGKQYTMEFYSLKQQDTYYQIRQTFKTKTVTMKKDHQATCTDGECRSDLECLDGNGAGSQKYCLCQQTPNPSFWDETSSTCKSVNTLAVSTVSETPTATSVELEWTVLASPPNVKYGLTWPGKGREDVISPKTLGPIDGLSPGQSYTYTLVAYFASDQYYAERVSSQYTDTVSTKKDHQATCTNSDQCRSGLECIDGDGAGSQKYCLCQQTPTPSFWDETSSTCKSVNTLAVSTVSSTSTATSVTLTWTVLASHSNVKYGLTWPGKGREQVTSPKQVNGLSPGQTYQYSLVAYLVSDSYYAERVSTLKTDSVSTKKDHEDQCNGVGECRFGLTCRTGASVGTKHCLCGATSFWHSSSNACFPVNFLKVNSISTASTATSATLSWTESTLHPNVKYGLSWAGGAREEVTNPKTVNGLSPGQSYSYSLVAYLVSDQYYAERVSTSETGSVSTKKDHKAECTNNVECRSGLECIDGNGAGSPKYCLCQQTPIQAFWHATSSSCKSVEGLKVVIGDVTVTSSSVTLTWTSDTFGLPVQYGLKWHNEARQQVNSPKTVGQLQSNEDYSYSIIAYLGVDGYYPERSATFTSTVSTKKDHQDTCTNSVQCRSGLECIDGNGGGSQKYCLCQQTPNQAFWHAATTSCKSVEDLKIAIGDVTVASSSVTLKWTSNTFGLPVKYGLKWHNEARQQVTSPKTVGQLQSNKDYSYSIIAYLGADGYYPERSATFTSTVSTNSDHTESCASNNECRIGLTCISGVSAASPKYCLCNPKDSKFWHASTATCKSVNDLAVSITNTATTATDVTFTWTFDSFNLQGVAYEIRWNEGGSQSKTVTSSPSSVTDLTPGKQYTIDFYSIKQQDTFYPFRQTFKTKTVTMKPAQPGQVNVSKSQLQDNPMTVVFDASDGQVSSYLVTLVSNDDGSSNTSSTSSTSLQATLRNGAVYNYTITPYNSIDEAGLRREGSFKTVTKTPSQVATLETRDLLSSSVEITWTVPDYPNGNIKAFVVSIRDTESSSCLKAYTQRCSDCLGFQNLNTPDCASKEGAAFTASNVVINSSHLFSQQFTGLEPINSYVVTVYAINEDYAGEGKDIEFTTAEAGANNLRDIIMTPQRDESAMQVYLEVQLIPGVRTGETNFTVKLKNQGTGQVIKTEVLVGYTNTNLSFPDLLANHQYIVSAYAETKVGPSLISQSNVVTTLYNKPGTARELIIVPDSRYATEFTLSLKCPPQPERNGTIQKAIITRTNLGDSDSKDFTFPMPESCDLSVPSTQLGSFIVSQNYSFSAVLQIQEFDSDQSEVKYFYSEPKKPIFEVEDQDIITVIQTSEFQSETAVQLRVDVSRFNDNSQGRIVLSSLIVCIKSPQNSCNALKRRKRSIETVNVLSNYRTWAAAEANGFKDPFRATPDDWLQKVNSDEKYTVGGNGNCQTGAKVNIYCNGPLPSGMDVQVTAIRCTTAGCAESDAYTFKTKVADDSNAGLIAGIVVAVLVVVALAIVAAVFFIRRRRKPKDMERIMIEEYGMKDHRPIPIRKFKESVQQFHKDANLLFQGEFEDIKTLSSQLKTTTNEALKEENRVKNRYVDILPFDHSRVKLQVSMENDDISDYINANYIPGFSSVREYIATQGPMHATIPHFWRMVWEQKSKVIVMLSDLTENNKLKVSLYWPENLNEPIGYGDFVVEMTNFSQLNKYIIRNFRITFGGQSRRITHFFIPGWWDFGANLTYDDVLEFAQLIRKEATPPNSGPVVVHCSAGVGRTGTFIALDYFSQYIDKHGLDTDLDIFAYVMSMRKNRPRMVQAEPQYIFIFDALLEVIERKIKAEQENLEDDDTKDDHIYNNEPVNEENIYVNANGGEDHTYSNQGFVGDYENMAMKPTTVL